jgi:hypothetical protein
MVDELLFFRLDQVSGDVEEPVLQDGRSFIAS